MKDMAKKAVAIAILIILWWLAAVVVNNRILPSPAVTFWAFVENWESISFHALHSLRRLGGGVGLALLISIPIGMLMGYFKAIDTFFAPIIYILAPIPKVVFLPLIMLFLGLGDIARIFLLFITISFPITIALRDAVKKIPADVYAPLIAAKLSPLFIFYNVAFLGGLPAVFTAVRLSLAVGMSVLFISENFGTRMGLGYFIMESWTMVRYPAMFAGILAMGTLGIILTALVNFLQKRICPWTK